MRTKYRRSVPSEKSQVRAIAEELGPHVGNNAGQHGDLLVPDQDYARFIEENSGKKIPEGNFVTTDGKIVGRHRGITHYTVGQRKGLNLSMGKPVFVLENPAETNEVVIGDGRRSMQTG